MASPCSPSVRPLGRLGTVAVVEEEDLAAEVTSAVVVEVTLAVVAVAVAEGTSAVAGDSAVVEQDFILLDHDSAVAVPA